VKNWQRSFSPLEILLISSRRSQYQSRDRRLPFILTCISIRILFFCYTMEGNNNYNQQVRWRWLVFTSLILTFLIEVLPTEADLLLGALHLNNIELFFAIKVGCLAVILFPLVLYVSINGWRGIMSVKFRTALIMIIIILKLVGDILLLNNWRLKEWRW
jgi:hypothetical protein